MSNQNETQLESLKSELLTRRKKTIAEYIADQLPDFAYILVVMHPGSCIDPECKICKPYSVSEYFEVEGFTTFADLKAILRDMSKLSGLRDTAFEYTDDIDKLLYNNSIYTKWGVFRGDGTWLKLIDSALELNGLKEL